MVPSAENIFLVVRGPTLGSRFGLTGLGFRFAHLGSPDLVLENNNSNRELT